MLFSRQAKPLHTSASALNVVPLWRKGGVRTCATDHCLSAEFFAQRSHMNRKCMLLKVLFAIGFLGLCAGCEMDSVECSPSIEANVNNRTSVDVVSTNSL